MQNNQEKPFETMTEEEQVALINAKLDELLRLRRISFGEERGEENGE